MLGQCRTLRRSVKLIGILLLFFRIIGQPNPSTCNGRADGALDLINASPSLRGPRFCPKGSIQGLPGRAYLQQIIKGIKKHPVAQTRSFV